MKNSILLSSFVLTSLISVASVPLENIDLYEKMGIMLFHRSLY